MNSDQTIKHSSSKRRPSRAVRARKVRQTCIKYEVIGRRRLDARIATANIIHVNGDDYDLSDAFQFMDWYNEHIARTIGDDGPVAESIIIEFRNNLLALDLTGQAGYEKIQFVMDIVQSPELSQVCQNLLSEPEPAVDAIDDIPLINLSDTDTGAQFTTDDSSVTTDNSGVPEQDALVSAIDELSVTDQAAAIVEEKESVRDDTPMGFIRNSCQARYCPILTYEEIVRQRFDVSDDQKLSRIVGYVAHWSLKDFMDLMITPTSYADWIESRRDDRTDILNVRCCYTKYGATQHRMKNLYLRGYNIDITTRAWWQGLTGISKGIGIVTTGTDECRFIRV
jgi:hypothetical protein